MKPEVKKIQDQVKGILRRRGVVLSSSFGSIARGDSTSQSDIDFRVEFERGRVLFDLAGLQLDLTAALSREVDVATPNSLHLDLT